MPLVSLFLLLCSFSLQAQVVSGVVSDAATGETLVGVNVLIEGTTDGVSTDLDGRYTLTLPAENTNYALRFSYVSYQTKQVAAVSTTKDRPLDLNITLETGEQQLGEVVITASLRCESVAALLSFQKNNVAIADVMPGDVIRRTPDRNTGEILRRVSGTTIQDNRFAVVRGLADRYNLAMLNNTLMPSTEPDRRAFAFDLIPSSMVDNMVVSKTASADLFGEFAGGIIQVQTRDVPEKNFIGLQVAGSYHSLTTFKDGLTYEQPQSFFGLTKKDRWFSGDFPDNATDYRGATEEQQAAWAQQLPNVWTADTKTNLMPNMSYQLTGGFRKPIGKEQEVGAMAALTYNHSFRNQPYTLSKLYDLTGAQTFLFENERTSEDINWGALVNVRYKLNGNNKINYQNLTTVISSNKTTRVGGTNNETQQAVQSDILYYVQTDLVSHQLTGDHYLPKSQIKVAWNGNYTLNNRYEPDYRRTYYLRDMSDSEDTSYTAYVPAGTASPQYFGRFYSQLHDQTYGGSADVTIPFQWLKQKQNIKVGGFYQGRTRDFSARVFGMVINDFSVYNIPGIFDLSAEELFAPENISPDAFLLDETTNYSDRYDVQRDIMAGYALWDAKLTNKLRLVAGVRGENVGQDLTLYTFNSDSTDTRSEFNLLPSVNITYALGDKANLRFSASQTVSRPEFRELAPFAFFDFETYTVVQGNPNLETASIYNFDVRYELFPESGQLVSFSAFYKHFDQAH